MHQSEQPSPQLSPRYGIRRHPFSSGRFYALYETIDPQQLVAVFLFKRGAMEVWQRLTALEAERYQKSQEDSRPVQ